MSEFETMRLGELLKFQNGRTSPERFEQGKFCVYGSNGVIGRSDTTNAVGPSVVIGRVGSYCGSVYFAKEDCWVTDNAIQARGLESMDNRYLYYLTLHTGLNNWRTGSGQPLLNQSTLSAIPVQATKDELEQRAIARVLGALDDKIESNRKLAGTLREYGQALLSQVMLQNSTFSPLRSVVASVARGVAPSYVEDSESPLVLNQRCIRNGRVELSAARRMSHRTVTPERLAQQGDVLVNSTGRGTLGRVARWNGNTVFVDGHVSVVKPDAKKFSPTVLAYLMLSCQTEIEELAEGSTGQTELSPKRLLDFQIAMPKAINAEKVEPELLDLELRGEKALQESDALEMLRDALLPELLSGRLRVKDAESMMENV
jgi:type I restriction enzyme S subunit